jgi:hypothetical protein
VNRIAVFLGLLVFLVGMAGVFQMFGRYQYVVVGQGVWRIDRLTNSSCRVVNGHCAPPPSSISTSTSTSTSISPKLIGHPARGQPKRT